MFARPNTKDQKAKEIQKTIEKIKEKLSYIQPLLQDQSISIDIEYRFGYTTDRSTECWKGNQFIIKPFRQYGFNRVKYEVRNHGDMTPQRFSKNGLLRHIREVMQATIVED